MNLSRRARPEGGIDIQPNPPVAGQGAVATLPHPGVWHVTITDASGNVTELGPLQADAAGQIDIPIPANADGGTLLVTDEGEPVPNDGSFRISSTN